VIGVAGRMVMGWKYIPAVDSPAPTGFKRVLHNKWYVDEIYDAIIVQPILAASRALWRFVDVGIIDRTVNGVGHVSRAVGWFGSRLQSGQINTYAFILVIGVLVILGFVVL
jgi:NADH-quinone oxidoreductase subunit L